MPQQWMEVTNNRPMYKTRSEATEGLCDNAHLFNLYNEYNVEGDSG